VVTAAPTAGPLGPEPRPDGPRRTRLDADLTLEWLPDASGISDRAPSDTSGAYSTGR
jgi:hypothetical protein